MTQKPRRQPKTQRPKCHVVVCGDDFDNDETAYVGSVRAHVSTVDLFLGLADQHGVIEAMGGDLHTDNVVRLLKQLAADLRALDGKPPERKPRRSGIYGKPGRRVAIDNFE